MILLPEMKTWYGLIATFGTIGRFSRMPGTVGSIAATAVWIAAGGVHWGIIAAVAVLGCLAADKYERAVERTDPPECVIDEVVGVWMASFGFDLKFAVVALFLFRIIDITKPFPICALEKLPGGYGIMADDMAGGLATNLLIRFIQWLFYAGGAAAILNAVHF